MLRSCTHDYFFDTTFVDLTLHILDSSLTSTEEMCKSFIYLSIEDAAKAVHLHIKLFLLCHCTIRSNCSFWVFFTSMK